MTTDHEEDRGGNGWIEYRRLVLSELKRLERKIGDESVSMREAVTATEGKLLSKLTDLQRAHTATREDVIALKVKSGVWGFAAGLIPAIGVLLFYLATKNGGS